MHEEACCTCARPLSTIIPQYDAKTEKPVTHDRRLTCCGRCICGSCIAANERFLTYCPFCQITTGPSSLPQGLYDPPSYSPPRSPPVSDHLTKSEGPTDDPPAYSPIDTRQNGDDPNGRPVKDVLHYIHPSKDTVQSLGISYGVPQDALRRKNGLYADHLIVARKTVLIPGEYYKRGVSLSPQPIDVQEEEERKSKIRKFMVTCKVSNYDVAVLYLEQAKQDLSMAIESYLADEKWEAENPMQKSSKGKDRQAPRRTKFSVGGGLAGQL